MATEQLSPESTPQKRQRRLKQDPLFVFEHPSTSETEMDTASTSNNQTPLKNKTKPVHPIEDNSAGADLYEPGDVVWSKLGSFPWWPALIYRCDAEDGIYTKTFNSYNKTKRQYFVYFYGKYLEYAWLSTRSLLKYSGLNDFIQNAETAVQQASTKSEQVELANRYQLKVSIKKRVQWDEAIELADHALTITKDERIKEFSDLLNDVKYHKKQSKKDIRRRKASIDKNEDEETIPNKRPTRTSELPDEANISSSSHIQSGDDHDQPIKKKRGRKPKSESKMNGKNNTSISHVNHSKTTNENETEYEYLPSVNNPQKSSPLIHFIQAKIPPLSNYEQKQIVEGIMNHHQADSLSFEEAQTFAANKAIEIVYENHNHRMDQISPEWFYDSILLKYPSVVFKHHSWFEHIKPDVIPDGTDSIKLKQWQISLMIQAQLKAEKQQHQEESSSNKN